MKKFEIIASVAVTAAGLLVSAFHVPAGAPGMIILFLAAVVTPGYLLCRAASHIYFDVLEIYALSVALGISIFVLWGIILFVLNAPIDVAIPGILAANVALLAWNFRRERSRPEADSFAGSGGLGWIVIIVVVIITIISYVLGSARGWGEDWDHYTYITMVRRLAARGVASNYPIAYAGERPDPVHSYNAWALLWAAISRGARIDPISLYIKSAVLTVPATLLAFYSLCKTLFGRSTALVGLLPYASYHLFGMGLILLGRSSFYNDDPAWLILFPVAVGLGWSYLGKGGKGLLALAMLALAGSFIVHPLWGLMLLPAFGLNALVSLWPGPAHDRLLKTGAQAGVGLFFIPVLYALGIMIFYGENDGKRIGFWPGIVIFCILPFMLVIPWVVRRAIALWKDDKVKRSWLMLASSVVVAVPFILMRFSGARVARPEVYFETSPYKYFIESRLFVLHPSNFTYTAPDMTLYPLSLLGVAALPWLIGRYFRGERAAGLVSAGVILVPLIATHPYMAYLFSKMTHAAYLRRALRFSAMFAACGAGALVSRPVLLRPRFAGVSALFVGLIVSAASAVYPYSPTYFQGAFSKSWFIMAHAPARGLFWHPEYNAHKNTNVKWDTEQFAELVERAPDESTIFSDRFTSYRLTAYKDVYVTCRMKPSTGASDQTQREADQAKFFDPSTDSRGKCQVLKNYGARRVLLNVDPDYHLREYYLGDPWTVEKIAADKERFTLIGRAGDWVLFRATGLCW